MRPGNFHLLRVAGLLLGAATGLFAGNFAPPAEGPVAFRRDRVPLDAETMAGLSRHLVTLAEGLDFKSAVTRRAAAQLLALAAALDPANGKARELISAFEKDNRQPVADPAQIEASKAEVWQDLGWLETPEAGSQGQALAACLTDVMLISDPAHPRAEALRAGGERGAWKGWIPELAAYETVVVVKSKPPEETVVATPGILLAKAQVFTPLWKKVGQIESQKWVLSFAPLTMSAEMIPAGEDGPKPFSMRIGSAYQNNSLSQLSFPLLQLLKKQHGSLPANGRVTINSEALETSLLSNKRHSISAAVAVLASAAVSGREPDATIIGLTDETGAFKLPSGFWDQLQSLGPGNGGRLVLPAAAAPYLPSMLALERPGFFLEHEVLLASNFQELLEFSQKTPVANLEKPSAQFREIREKATSQAVGQYLANSFVRRRLAEIVLEAPFHYSAKMLALQGSGNRPAFIPRNVLAAELRRAIEPLAWIAKRNNFNFERAELNQLASIHETCRNEVDRLFRYTEKADRELLVHVQEMITALRPFERAVRTREEFYSQTSDAYAAYSALVRAYGEVSEELAAATGDVDALPAR